MGALLGHRGGGPGWGMGGRLGGVPGLGNGGVLVGAWVGARRGSWWTGPGCGMGGGPGVILGRAWRGMGGSSQTGKQAGAIGVRGGQEVRGQGNQGAKRGSQGRY